MFEGSSALHYEGQKQIVTPKIKALLRDNYRGTTITIQIGGYIGGDNGFNTGIYFKNHYIVLDASSTRVIRTLDRTSQGLTSVYTFSLTGLVTYNYRGGKFYDTGDTLVFFGTIAGHTPSSTYPAITRLASHDGLTWGGITNIYTETTITHEIADVAPIGNTQLYFLKGASTGSSQLNLYRINAVGTSWGVTEKNVRHVYMDQYTIDLTYGHQTVNAIKPTDTEYVFMTTSNIGSGIRMLNSDGVNMFNEYDIFSPDSINGTVFQRSITSGPSLYYMGLYIRHNTGVSAPLYTETTLSTPWETFFMRSQDLIHWSIPIRTGGTYHTIVAAGRTVPELTLFGISRGMDITLGNSSVDISNDIISYRNEDNNRISLVLSNYR